MSYTSFPGDVLRKKREALGLSVSDLYERIHVPAIYLQAMEDGDLAALPGVTYTLGFLQTYCEFLEVDPEPYLDRFRGYLRDSANDRAPVQAAPKPALALPHPPWAADLLTWGAICALLLFAWFTYSVVIQPFAADPQPGVEAGTVEIPLEPPVPHFEDRF